MKKNLRLLIISLLAIGSILSGCGVLVEPSSWPGITADENTVYVSNDSHLYALQLNNGNLKWKFPLESDSDISFYAAPVLTRDGQLLVGSYSQSDNNGYSLYSLDPNRGTKNWEFPDAGNRYIGSPLVTDVYIYAPNADNTLYKLDLQGNLISGWSFQADDPLWAQPVLEGDNLFLTSMDHHIYALDANSARYEWSPKDLGSAIASPPLIGTNGTLYVGTFGSQILAINPANGAVLWEAKTEDWAWSSPSEIDGKLFVGDQSGTFYILEAATGNELWRMQADGAILGSPLIIGNNVYFATEAGSVYLVESSGFGENVWTFDIIKRIEGRILGPLLAAGNLILIGSIESDSLITAIDQDGSQVWSFSPDN